MNWFDKSRTEYINEARLFYHLAKSELEEKFRENPALESYIGDMYDFLSSFDGMYKVVNIFDHLFKTNESLLNKKTVEDNFSEHLGKNAGLIRLVA